MSEVSFPHIHPREEIPPEILTGEDSHKRQYYSVKEKKPELT